MPDEMIETIRIESDEDGWHLILPDYIPADGEHEPDQAEALREYADRARKESKERPYPEGPLASRRVDP